MTREAKPARGSSGMLALAIAGVQNSCVLRMTALANLYVHFGGNGKAMMLLVIAVLRFRVMADITFDAHLAVHARLPLRHHGGRCLVMTGETGINRRPHIVARYFARRTLT